MAQVANLRTENKFKKTEIGEIPVDWELSRIKNHTELITKGTTPTTYGHAYPEKGVLFLRVENITEDGRFALKDARYIAEETHKFLRRSQLKEGDILFSIAGELGRLAIVTPTLLPANINQTLAIVRLKDDIADRDFLKYALRMPQVIKQVNLMATQLVQAHLNLQQVGEIKFPLPPKFEQKKIAEILSTVDRAIEKIVEVIEKTHQLKKGLMHQLLTRGIGHKKFKKNEIGEIPVDWDTVRLGEVVHQFINGGTPDTKQQSYWQGNIPWITGADFESQKIKKIRRYITLEAVKNSSTNIIPKDSVLVVTRTGVGKLAITPFDIAISQDIIGVIPNEDMLNAEFLYWYLNKHSHRLVTLVQGTSINGLLREDLQSLTIALPPRSEQKKIVEILLQADEEIQEEAEQKATLEDLKKGLMRVLLTGKIRVKS